ncbi:MAG: YicC family protein [Devosiaceae bacterium]|nr:YicC family protein [Devosiaceae bacterium MH13]
MPLNSMTGFARAEEAFEGGHAAIEARCVNGRSSDIKLRLPSGLEALDGPLREAFKQVVRRGNLSVTVSLQREQRRVPRVNTEALKALKADLDALADAAGEARPALSSLLGVHGIVEMVDVDAFEAAGSNPSDMADALQDHLKALAQRCATDLGAARAAEGEALRAVLAKLFEDIEAEVTALRQLPDASPEHLFARLRQQVTALLGEAEALDMQRLHQEAAHLATKADIAEEIARLDAHIEAGRGMLSADEPVGRKLDFLAQELNREANTICSKASALPITQHGLALKALIDQVKEQVQNVE